MTATVTVADYSFSPSSVTLLKGGTVTFNFTVAGHNLTFNGGPSTGDMGGGTTYARTFDTPGTYTYLCPNHYGMTGQVVVQ